MTELWGRYLAERFPLRFWLPLAVALALLGGIGAPRALAASTATAMLALVLPALLAARIADDLADRAVDRVRHPERVTVVARSVAPLVALACAAAAPALGVAVTLLPLGHAVLLGATAALLAAWYLAPARGGLRSQWNAPIVLLKYPALVSAAAGVAGASRGTAAGAALVAYLAALAFELADDPELRARTRPVIRGTAAAVALLALAVHLHHALGTPP